MSDKIYIIVFLLAFATVSARAQIAAAGAFTLEKSVVAAGGGASSNGAFSVTGTNGQTAAGSAVSNAPFSHVAGFWVPDTLAPTAAGVSVGGRVLSAQGEPLRNATINLTDAEGVSRVTRSSSFGYYRFENIAAGQTVILNVKAKGSLFAPVVVSVMDNLTELNIIALP